MRDNSEQTHFVKHIDNNNVSKIRILRMVTTYFLRKVILYTNRRFSRCVLTYRGLNDN